MILRLSAALALAAGLVTLMAFLHLIGRGPFASEAARHLRAMKDRATVPSTAQAVTLAWMRTLPHGRPPAETAPFESRGVSLEGYVQRILWSSDGDTHLEIAPEPPPADSATRYVTAEITRRFRERHPGWGYGALAATLRPNLGSGRPWPGGPRRARVTGWLFYDLQYDAPVPDSMLDRGAPRVTGWEIHPVTRLEVWDDTRGAWAEVGP